MFFDKFFFQKSTKMFFHLFSLILMCSKTFRTQKTYKNKNIFSMFYIFYLYFLFSFNYFLDFFVPSSRYLIIIYISICTSRILSFFFIISGIKYSIAWIVVKFGILTIQAIYFHNIIKKGFNNLYTLNEYRPSINIGKMIIKES